MLSRFWGAYPLLSEHAVQVVIHVSVVQPFRFATDPFQGETEAFWDGAAGPVLNGTANFDAVERQFVKSIVS